MSQIHVYDYVKGGFLSGAHTSFTNDWRCGWTVGRTIIQ